MTKSQIDRLGERLRAGSIDREDLEKLARYRNQFVAPTSVVMDRIASAVGALHLGISQRPSKSTPSIVAKLRREKVRLTQMQDIGGVRVVVADLASQDLIVTIVQRLYFSSRILDRRASPRFGYRAVHVIVMEEQRLVEVQIRTRLQNLWAQASEKIALVKI